ncbi:MAG TPA: alpha-2-macroglobulin family protein [Roseimicrobium sp.]|nr:alpha-2-macroglobulin family protein [Roseimicrobium sp.]
MNPIPLFSRVALLATMLFPFLISGQSPDFARTRATAEEEFSKGNFAQANRLYREVNVTNLPSADQRWVRFRVADTQWRAQAGTRTADTTVYDQSQSELNKLVRDVLRTEDRDLVWTEVYESIGDYWWVRQDNRNWPAAWANYQQSLDWWAGSADLDVARERYLKIIQKIAAPPGREQYYYYGYYGNSVPQAFLENALKIAKRENDIAQIHYLMAMTVRYQGGDWEMRQRVPEEFEAALKPGKSTDWYDDALYHYAEWLANNGRVTVRKDGGWNQEQDYPKALELFRRLVKEFNKGETRYWEQAQQQIRNITDPTLSVGVSHIFLPGSEVQYHLNWRNLQRIDLALYPVDLTKDVNLAGQEDRRSDWLQSIDLSGREKVKSWTHDTKDKGDYKPGNESLKYEGKLPPGAYIIEAKAGGKSARDLILVNDSSLVLKTSGKQALVYFADALSGAPVPEANVTLWERWHDGKRWQAKQQSKVANKDGIAVFDLSRAENRGLELFAAAKKESRQAFSSGNSYGYGRDFEPWRIYAYTDRPAYRPNESVQWKFLARRYDGSVYTTPADQTIEFEVNDPRGTKIKADKVKLNAFGSVWGSLDLTAQMPLGEYTVQFWNEGRKKHIGSATLFRLEEYKLPEFKVSVQTPEENGRRKAFRIGEQVEVSVQADYYFGGAVANGSVEVIVYQNTYYQYWRQPREFGWYYEDENGSGPNRWRGGGNGQIIKRETLKTDATGKATLTFDTPRNSGQDFEYKIEARVTDSSRREITGNGTVRVTRQRYYVYPKATHNLHKPQDKVAVDFKVQDANEQPVTVEGTVKVTREYWYEIWISPEGKEVKGDELKQVRTSLPVFPPPPRQPDGPGWRLKFRGYERDEILTRPVKTDAKGEAQFTFTPEREGYYRVSWTSIDEAPKRPPQPITADTTVWVANNATTELGYRQGGVEIIADKDTFRVGQIAPIMLVVPTNDRYVLFSTEGEDLYSYQLVHVTGTVKLVELPITEQHVPNFTLGAAMISDRQIFTDTKPIIVPPTKNFLTVDVKPERPQYQPREEGIWTVTTKDHEGKPVAAEVALSVVDESVFYIQSDYAGDPRQFYYGTKREHRIGTQSTFNQKSYAKLIEGEDRRLRDEKEVRKDAESLRRSGGVGGGGGGNMLRADLLDAQMATDSTVSSGRMMERSSLALGAAMPASAPMAKSASYARAGEKAKQDADKDGRENQQQQPEPPVQVRSDFRSTIVWKPDVTTDAKGQATIRVTYPDSLTGWKAVARVASAGNQFGIADSSARTKQPLIARLQAPRFFLIGDEVTVSVVINNNTDTDLQVTPKLELDGLVIVGVSRDGKAVERKPGSPVTVSANGEAREDWIVRAQNPGTARIKVTARGGKYADAMEKTYQVFEHGIEKFLSKAGKARANDITVRLDIPKERKPESTKLTVQVTPSMAVTMLDALPYLINYPYGCTEQTMSRFLPAAITAKTLKDLGLQPEDVMSRVFGGIEPGTPQPVAKKDLKKLDDMVKAGLERLYDFQHADGGWGWWKEGGSDHWMTAYVVWGLSLAKQAGVEIKDNTLTRGADYLDKTLVEEEENPDMQAWMLHALAAHASAVKSNQISKFQQKAFDTLWINHTKLNAYTRSLFALAAHQFGKAAEAKQLVLNLENGVKRDDRPDTSVLIQPGTANQKPDTTVQGTAHWGEDGVYWRWSEGGVEATAWALRALLAIDPKNALVEPVTNWLIKNRRGAQWNNTRDTAMVILAMNDYLRTSGELNADIEYEVFVNGKSVAKKQLQGTDALAAPARITIDPKLVRDGANDIRIKRKTLLGPPKVTTVGRERGDGTGSKQGSEQALYFAVEATFFSLEEPIPAAGSELFVKREYFKLVGKPTLLKGYVYDRMPLKDGESVKSGERVETLLTIETKNNYEYLLFEDLKPAGFEAVEIRSGNGLMARELKSGAIQRKFSASAAPEAVAAPAVARNAKIRAVKPAVTIAPQPNPIDTDHTGRSRWVYQELRDRKVALFIDKLPEGVWEIRYDFRAEVPGQFHALPVMGQAMYVPEIRANSAEQRVTVLDVK